jgi:hypothetical protein
MGQKKKVMAQAEEGTCLESASFARSCVREAALLQTAM